MAKNYIKNGKPALSGGKSKYKQGYYKPKNPSKYKGDIQNIIFRSGLELKWYTYFDTQPAFIEWCCEEVVVPYRSPKDNKIHRYFIDVWVKYIDKSGIEKELIIEIKPLSQTFPPKIPKYKGKTYKYNVQQYVVNESKWESAYKYAEENNMVFMLLTEKGMKKYKLRG